MNALDEQIIALIRKNTEKGMSVLIDRYTPLVFTIVRNNISPYCSAQDIEETVSDVFVEFYKSLDRFDFKRGTLSAFISTLAKRKAYDTLRKKRLVNTVSTDDENEFIEIPSGVDIEYDYEKKELAKRLIEVINSLGEPDSTIVYRKYYLFENSAEIARFTGLSEDNVRQRLSRSLRKIKTIMEGDYYEN